MLQLSKVSVAKFHSSTEIQLSDYSVCVEEGKKNHRTEHKMRGICVPFIRMFTLSTVQNLCKLTLYCTVVYRASAHIRRGVHIKQVYIKRCRLYISWVHLVFPVSEMISPQPRAEKIPQK